MFEEIMHILFLMIFAYYFQNIIKKDMLAGFIIIVGGSLFFTMVYCFIVNFKGN